MASSRSRSTVAGDLDWGACSPPSRAPQVRTSADSATKAANRCFMSLLGQACIGAHAAVCRLEKEIFPLPADSIELCDLPVVHRPAGGHDVNECLAVDTWRFGRGWHPRTVDCDDVVNQHVTPGAV